MTAKQQAYRKIKRAFPPPAAPTLSSTPRHLQCPPARQRGSGGLASVGRQAAGPADWTSCQASSASFNSRWT